MVVQGSFEGKDGEQFFTKTGSLTAAIVRLESNGGSLVAGIQIGETIRLKGLQTLVPAGARCASACAMAWLGGTQRFMGPGAQIGLHLAYNANSEQGTGVANALLGAYLNRVGLPLFLGIDAEGHKHPLGLIEGATENAAVVQALIDNLIERGLDPKVCRLFIVDGAKALSKVIRRTFGVHTPIQRCQLHKARNVIERLPKPLHASVRRALRQAWELGDPDKAERLLATSPASSNMRRPLLPPASSKGSARC